MMDGNLVLAGEPEWQILEHLARIISVSREQLRYLSKLPPWAGGPKNVPNPSYEPSSLAI